MAYKINELLVRYLCMAVMLLAGIVLCGWAFDLFLLKSILKGYISMNPLSAVIFIFLATGMLSTHKARNPVAMITVIIIIVFGVLTLKISDLVFFTNFKPDKFLFTGNLKGNQMAVATVINFVLIATSLYLSAKRGSQWVWISQLISLLTLLVSSIYICAYLFNLNSIIGVSVITPMAIQSAVCFVLLSTAIISVHPRRGFMKTITSESVGGMVTRKTLPLIILIPFVIGYLSLAGQRKGLYNSEFSIAIFVVVTSLLCAAIMWHYGKMINAIHGEWKNTESDLNSSVTETKNLMVEIETKNDVLTYTALDLEGKIRQLEEFNKIVAHNLRGPAGSIQTLINMALESNSDQEKLDFLGLLKQSSKNLIDTLTDLVAIMEVRLNTQIAFDDCSFIEIIRKVEQMLKGEMISKKASIIVDLKTPGLKYPRIYLESIFYNMISNALKYSKNEEQPLIDLVRHADQLFKLHQTFHQGRNSKGIGLFMTKNQIETFGGSISVKSKPGQGTEFTITI
jgi:signal transduction histidine kinase